MALTVGKAVNLGDQLKTYLQHAFGLKEVAREIGEGIDAVKDVTIPTASVLTLNATEYELIAAPGAGLCIVVTGVYGTIDYNSATYSASTDTLDIRYTDSSGDLVAQLTNAFIELAADGRAYADIQAECVPVANAAIIAHVANADPTTGDSDIKLRLYYRILPTLL